MMIDYVISNWRLQTLDCGEHIGHVDLDGSERFEMTKRWRTREEEQKKKNSSGPVCVESTLMCQLNEEASQLSATLHRGLDMCRPETPAGACGSTNQRPLARHLDDLQTLYQQVSTQWMSSCFD